MALHARYNENGTKILCEHKDISQLEINGYKYKESPIEAEIEAEDKNPYEKSTVTDKEVVKDILPPNSKTTRRNTRKSAQTSNEKDIIL